MIIVKSGCDDYFSKINYGNYGRAIKKMDPY
jgi:hypothetical protein